MRFSLETMEQIEGSSLEVSGEHIGSQVLHYQRLSRMLLKKIFFLG